MFYLEAILPSFLKESKEGSKLIAIGGIDVYVKTGRMQFKASRVQPVKSIGELEKARQELIQRWREDGTMDGREINYH